MKKFKIIYLALLLPIFASTCGEEEVTPETAEWYEEVYGKWSVISIGDYVLADEGEFIHFEFKVDGNLHMTTSGEVDEDGNLIPLEMTWKHEGEDEIVITNNPVSTYGIWPDEMTWNISSLTETSMTVTADGPDVQGISIVLERI